MSVDDSGRSHLSIPTGRWIRLSVPECADFVGYTYIDPQEGLAAKGQIGDRMHVVRLPAGKYQVLDQLDVIKLGLPDVPEWLGGEGPQPTIGTSWGAWLAHPKLAGRFHPHNQDDVQVLVHEGGPRLSEHQPELLWVRVNNVQGNLFTGLLVDKPAHLTQLKQGATVLFVVPDGGQHPILVTRKYLDEKPGWVIHPCQTCGLTELLDAPSDLVHAVFPELPEGSKTAMFTAKCGACGGIQGVEQKYGDDEAPPTLPPKWWQMWKKKS
ncbi:MAG: hypothetical protein AB7K24_14480 [Gemmataceae bacterium]